MSFEIASGLYRAIDGTMIRVLYARGGMVSYWEVADHASANDPAGKNLSRMTAEKFFADGFSVVESTP